MEQNGNVSASVLGPRTCVANGEVSSSLLGPAISFQHQALLTAVLWPEGKGRVSHGVKVGLRRTASPAEQSFHLAEGMYLGLGVLLRSPADFSSSPYSILACGVRAMPQKVMFPFSLICCPSAHWEGVSPGCNEILPAWVLTDDLYVLKSMENRAEATGAGTRLAAEFNLLRPEIIDVMTDALRRLQAVPLVKSFYTETDIQGLGKNVLLEAHRQQAIEAYQFFIRYYALLGLKARVHNALQSLRESGPMHVESGGWKNYVVSQLLQSPAAEPRWEHQRGIVRETWGDVVAASASCRICSRRLPAMSSARGPRTISAMFTSSANTATRMFPSAAIGWCSGPGAKRAACSRKWKRCLKN